MHLGIGDSVENRNLRDDINLGMDSEEVVIFSQEKKEDNSVIAYFFVPLLQHFPAETKQ